MANYPVTPQTFSFAGRSFNGQLTSWTGARPRRSAEHRFVKRRASLREDMNDGPQSIQVRLVFIQGPDVPNLKQAYLDFLSFLQANPTGLLVHPTVGRWQAFCDGPKDDVDLSQAINKIAVTVAWNETIADGVIPRDTPDAATAAQQVTAQSVSMQQSVASVMGEIAIQQARTDVAIAQIQEGITEVADDTTAPMDTMLDVLHTVGSAAAKSIGIVTGIKLKADALVTAVSFYVDSASDLFDGSDVPASASDTIETAIGQVQTAGDDLEAILIAASWSPAGVADCVGEVEETVAACLVLRDALQAQRPAIILDTVKQLTDIIAFATVRYPGDNASARASQMMGLNRIPNPAAIPAGTRLRRYAK